MSNDTQETKEWVLNEDGTRWYPRLQKQGRCVWCKRTTCYVAVWSLKGDLCKDCYAKYKKQGFKKEDYRD